MTESKHTPLELIDLGKNLGRQGKFKESLEAFEMALFIKPNNAEALRCKEIILSKNPELKQNKVTY